MILSHLFYTRHGLERAMSRAARNIIALGASVSKGSPKFSVTFLGGCMNWKRFFFVAFALLIVLSMGSTKLAAQATTSTGGIQGAVTDAQGGVVPNAKVTITNKATGQVIDLVTSSAGEFSAGALGAGTYVVRIETPNFKTAETTLVVQVGQITPANTRLEIGG